MNASEVIKGYGGPAKLAKALGLKPALVWRWQDRGIPANKAGKVASLTGIPLHVLRPDLFDAPTPAAAQPERVA